MNLFARLAAGFPADRGRAFLETADGGTVSFAELLERTGRIAALLAASGVTPGDRVAVQVEKSVANICLYLAVLQSGAVYVPLNTGYTPAELSHFLADAEPRVMVCDPAAQAALAPMLGRAWLFTLDAGGAGSLTAQAEALPSERGVAARAGGDLAAILYTSGTTGRSKGAMLTHDNLWSNVATLHAAWGFRPDDVLIHALPLFHIHGLFVALNLMLLNGGRMILLAEVRRGAGDRAPAASDGADGRADLLHPPPRQPGPDARGGRGDAALHLGLGAAPRQRPTRSSRRGPASASSSATA